MATVKVRVFNCVLLVHYLDSQLQCAITDDLSATSLTRVREIAILHLESFQGGDGARVTTEDIKQKML